MLDTGLIFLVGGDGCSRWAMCSSENVEVHCVRFVREVPMKKTLLWLIVIVVANRVDDLHRHHQGD